MLPRATVELRWDVDFARVRRPDIEDFETGGFGTRGYSAGLVADASWEEAEELLQEERTDIARLQGAAKTEGEYDDLAREVEVDRFGWDMLEGPVAGLDLGMAAACTALCAAGCLTAASCRGQSSWSKFPLILLSADAERARIVLEAARAASCGMLSRDDGRLEIWAQSVTDVLALAEQLLARRARFDALAGSIPPRLFEV